MRWPLLLALAPAFLSPLRRTAVQRRATLNEALDIFGLEVVPSASELRRVFRKLAAKTHPDVTGSEEAFRRMVEAYRQLQSADPGAGKDKDAVDEFLQDWLSESVLGWGDFAQIERDTDDDGWAGRAPVLNNFVRRHDAASEGGVQEGDCVIFRLLQPIRGFAWGVGRVIAVQVNYSRSGPNGLLHLQPLRQIGPTLLEEDLDADVAITRATDRLELLAVELLADGRVQLPELGRAHVRAALGGDLWGNPPRTAPPAPELQSNESRMA
ncbi:unnamed protein product [Effrenium voratum]|uniref:J domain-containing protein n=1 Tax=Effrenium voratum TaxID=2562239 RepID=A0AA36I4G6_9DINO|nr:unnamed protein product [Effrenium voratum]